MCNAKSIKMVTPTKSRQNQYYNHGPGRHAKTPPRYHNSRKTTPSPTSDCFKTPQNKPKAEIMRCASEPLQRNKSRRSVTPPTNPKSNNMILSSSPITFAGPKCLEPPTPTSLPRPPTTWTRNECSARQALSFEDLSGKNQHHAETIDPLSQQLKMLLKVQA